MMKPFIKYIMLKAVEYRPPCEDKYQVIIADLRHLPIQGADWQIIEAIHAAIGDDGKMTKKEQSKLLKKFWAVVKEIKEKE